MIGCGKDPEPKIDGTWEITFTEFSDPDRVLRFSVQSGKGDYYYSQIEFNGIEDFDATIIGDGNHMSVNSSDENGNLIEIEFDYTFNGKFKFSEYSFKLMEYGTGDVLTNEVFTGSYSGTRK